MGADGEAGGVLVVGVEVAGGVEQLSGAAGVGGGVAYALALWLPVSGPLASLLALPVGAGVALPFIWPEVRMLFHL